MPQIIFSRQALAGIQTCQNFLIKENPFASKKAAEKINQSLKLLEKSPEIGRPVEDNQQLRELIIPFGHSGYTALYRYDTITERIVIIAFRHQKEAGY